MNHPNDFAAVQHVPGILQNIPDDISIDTDEENLSENEEEDEDEIVDNLGLIENLVLLNKQLVYINTNFEKTETKLNIIHDLVERQNLLLYRCVTVQVVIVFVFVLMWQKR